MNNITSETLENNPGSEYRGADRYLFTLKTRGPQTSAAIGGAFGISDEAARQQLVKLAREGLVEGVSEANGVGRPTNVWRLTPQGNARFPDTHADLTVQLLDSIRAELGEGALDVLIGARERQTRAAYTAKMAGDQTLAEKVAHLAAIRTAEGYMAECFPNEDGWLLVENHCPICAAASICQGFCRAELQVFQEVLGPDCSVTRTEHILAGARRCAYQISPRQPA